MKLSSRCTVILATAATVASFAPAPAFRRTAVGVAGGSSSSSALFISSWGTKGPPSRRADETENKNPEQNIQAYLKAPEPVEARDNIDGTVMVSGLVKSKERTDQFLFDLLNNQESAFGFDKIVAFVDDVKFAKKRLLSRSARYTGLLDKLDFAEASSAGGLPSADQMEGVKSWVAYFEGGDLPAQVREVAAVAKSAPSLQNVAILISNAVGVDAASSAGAVEALKETGKEYTLVAVGKLEDHAEGKIPFKFAEFGTEEGILPSDAIFSRDEAMRMISECLQLNAGANKAFSFSEVYSVNATEAKLIKGLREAGYARPQEIDHMLRNGTAKYQQALDEFHEKNPDWGKGIYATEAWWEDPKFKKSVEEAQGASVKKAVADENITVKDDRTVEIEKVAKEWAKREYFRQSMAGTVDEDMTEEAFTETVWERALFEGDLKYREMNGETPDAEAELETFQRKQERKQQTMLKRAKEELKEILEEEDLVGADLKATLDTDDDE